MPEKYFIKQLSTQTLEFDITTVTIVDGEKVVNLFDLTGYNFVFLLKKNKTDADSAAVINKTEAIDAVNRNAVINLTPDDTDIPAGMYYICTRYHFDSDHSIDGDDYLLEVRRSGTGVPE